MLRFLTPAALSLAFLLSSADASAAANPCGNIELTAISSCRFETSGGCKAKCEPISLVASCDGQCNLSTETTCTGSCQGDCEASCTADPPKFNCTATCTANADERQAHAAGSIKSRRRKTSGYIREDGGDFRSESGAIEDRRNSSQHAASASASEDW